jgi:hypothetical protein
MTTMKALGWMASKSCKTALCDGITSMKDRLSILAIIALYTAIAVSLALLVRDFLAPL